MAFAACIRAARRMSEVASAARDWVWVWVRKGLGLGQEGLQSCGSLEIFGQEGKVSRAITSFSRPAACLGVRAVYVFCIG